MTTASGIPPGVTLTFIENSAMQQDMGGELGSNMIILLGRSHCSDGDCLQTPV